MVFVLRSPTRTRALTHSPILDMTQMLQITLYTAATGAKYENQNFFFLRLWNLYVALNLSPDLLQKIQR